MVDDIDNGLAAALAKGWLPFIGAVLRYLWEVTHGMPYNTRILAVEAVFITVAAIVAFGIVNWFVSDEDTRLFVMFMIGVLGRDIIQVVLKNFKERFEELFKSLWSWKPKSKKDIDSK